MGLVDFFKKDKDDGFTLFAPLIGEAIPLTDVSDKAFSSEIIGKGVAIIPSEGKVYAPATGKITAFFPTGHAVGIITDAGVEIMVHVGLDTVNIEGMVFNPIAKQGDRVKKGDLLLEFDIDQIKELGYDIATPVIITNPDDYEKIEIQTLGKVQVGNRLIQVS